ncbi:MAG TPA: hypothetical protein DDZ67_10610 [Xanthomonadaceae bacterium]|nr:hypothetical protein [Xanthomonadaceae bacterium]
MLCLLVTSVYWAGLHGPFVFDDFSALVQNTRIHVSDLSWSSLRRAIFSFEPGGSGRQLAMASFAVNYALGGLDPWGWKLAGLLVHLANTWLVYLLCIRLLLLAGIRQWARSAAWIIALLWAIHPLQVSTVLYVVQRMETMSLTFVLLALLAYLRGRQLQGQGLNGWVWIGACVPLFGLSLACKESAALLPAYTLALESTLLGFRAGDARIQRFWRWAYAGGVVVAMLLFVAVVLPHYASADAYATRDFSAWQRVLTQLRLLPFYLLQMLLPLPRWMPFYYDDLTASTSLFSPLTTAGGAILLSVLLFGAIWLRRRMPLLSLGALWFFAAHLLTSNVVPLELAFEHRNYFALFGVLVALADLARRIPVRDGPGIKMVAIGAIVLVFGFLGVVRSATWGEPLLLATELASLNPGSPRAAHDLGVLYYEMADGHPGSPFVDFARREFERESSLPNASVLAEQSLILMDAAQGRPANPALWARLHDRLRTRAITPQTTGALFGMLGNREKGVELDDDALDQAFMLMFEKVQFPPYSYALVADHALRHSKNEALARQLLDKAVDRSVETPEYLQVLIHGLRKGGHEALALAVIERAKMRGMEP